ncbi:carboxymuconolactone decarboxylase family protein [Mameliella alba]|uniref:Putative 4-carboxymuconolactone decarboxylase n=1 Tax=Mameliella alba TaxID=561184 RepID=A0A0B3S3U7_9RHOB|nr:carboxymuconolactone decarboxylase family protein [Mameliella alba]KHQ51361.1 putative 4-carboxymuconolactone decarboxylase [Mameliella alba]
MFEARGVAAEDLPVADPDLLPLNEEAAAARQSFVQGTYGETSKGVVDYTVQLLFLDLWLRPDLAPRDRSMVTVAALITAGQPDQMSFHLNRAMDNGLTQEEAGGVLAHLAFYAGWTHVFSAMPVAKEVFKNRAD